MLYYVDYQSKNGGINNLQIVNVTLDNGKQKTFTSLKSHAEKYAKAWIKKENNQRYYFAGGMYGNHNNIKFGSVRPTKGLPYITLSDKGLGLTSHHSSLYLLSKDLTEAYLIDPRSGGVAPSPVKVKLDKEMQEEFKKVISQGNFY